MNWLSSQIEIRYVITVLSLSSQRRSEIPSRMLAILRKRVKSGARIFIRAAKVANEIERASASELLTARSHAQRFIYLCRVVSRQNAHEQFMRCRRISPTVVAECAGCQLVAPDVREQESSRERAAYAARLVTEVQIPQCFDAGFRQLRRVPAATDVHGYGWGDICTHS